MLKCILKLYHPLSTCPPIIAECIPFAEIIGTANAAGGVDDSVFECVGVVLKVLDSVFECVGVVDKVLDSVELTVFECVGVDDKVLEIVELSVFE